MGKEKVILGNWIWRKGKISKREKNGSMNEKMRSKTYQR